MSVSQASSSSSSSSSSLVIIGANVSYVLVVAVAVDEDAADGNADDVADDDDEQEETRSIFLPAFSLAFAAAAKPAIVLDANPESPMESVVEFSAVDVISKTISAFVLLISVPVIVSASLVGCDGVG